MWPDAEAMQEAVVSHFVGIPGSMEMCSFLIEVGADLNARSNSGR
jgi:hypothetical protein